MPPAAKNVYVILFDMNTQSKTDSLDTLSKIILYKRLSESKDHLELYLLNADRSSDDLPEGIFRLGACTELSTIFDDMKDIGTGKSDWLKALQVAINVLKPYFKQPGIITLQVLLVTDLSSFDTLHAKLLENIIKDIQKNDIFLYVVGVDIEPPKIILSGDNIKEWMQKSTIHQNNLNLQHMQRIVTSTPHSVMCTYDIGVHLFNSFDYRNGMQPWQVPLTFASVLSLPVSTIRLTKIEAPLKLKSTNPRNTDDVKWVYAEQEDVEVSFQDAVGGLVKHGKFVKIETDGMFKVEGPRSFSALCVTSKENVPEYLQQSDGSYLVVPDENQSKEYLEFFYTLVEELEKTNNYIIARRVYNKDSNPKFVVLIPKTDLNVKGFVLCELPYADDIAHIFKKQKLEEAPEVEGNENIYTFLDKLNVSDVNCKITVPLGPQMMVDVNSLNIIKKVEEKTIQGKVTEEKKVNMLNLENATLADELKLEWPVRQLQNVKKEENIQDDFNEIGDFDFS